MAGFEGTNPAGLSRIWGEQILLGQNLLSGGKKKNLKNFFSFFRKFFKKISVRNFQDGGSQKKIAQIFFVILGLDKTMSVQLKAKKPLNVPGMEMIPIKTMNCEPYFVKTDKCFSYGVKGDSKFKTLSMSLKLDEETLKTLKNIVKECEDHLNSPLTEKLFYGDDENTIYPKLKRGRRGG